MAIFLILLFLIFVVALCMAPGCALRFLGVVIGIVVLVGASGVALLFGFDKGLSAEPFWYAAAVAMLGWGCLTVLLRQGSEP